MSDTSTPGDRLDAKLADLRAAVDNLRTNLQAAGEQLGAEVADAIDAVSAKVDEVQAAWEQRDTADDTEAEPDE